jgi:hypothetical protein
MALRLFKIGMLLALVVTGGVGILSVRRDNERLRRRAADAQRQREQIVQLRDANARAENRTAAAALSDASAKAAAHAELLRLRGEVAELEARGAARPTKAKTDATTLAANRDPEKDFVLVENFSNVGRGTPSAAFQTLVWAATKGDDRALASGLTLDGKAREQIEGMLAALPEAAHAKYPNAESVAALFFANLVTGHAAARVLGQDVTDPQHATVTIAFDRMSAGRPLAVRWTANGWQLAVTDEMAGEFQRQLRTAPEPKAQK